ncbi:glycosyltransferase [Microbispora triticiradicis]|uniref:Glycosyltransferase family 4 protein n=3 Tax=Microbispora TaxID=2005 RepID=A0ABY3LXQ5_9ACTN|nr:MULTISPECIES: glycosyltransferase [Microbispora]RGA00424.1 glycosyltransferase [Microbispora triticiradicis]TLP56331.1 glycosyltransferase family 4 protein [Microbispora fusca]TYB59017.1 glycosyltransferase family 4 protein [Microbispora tritici]
MKIMVWHVHGSWTTSFVHGGHEYLVPLTPDRGPDGRGRAETYPWPGTVREVPHDRLAAEDVDLIVYQRPHEIELAREWLGRDVPGVYVEHNTPAGDVPKTRHPLADRDDIPLVHVTHFNDLFWDSGRAPTHVIEHGVVDPGHLYSGELPRAGVVVNEPIRRWRVAGTDLLPTFATGAPIDVFGMQVTNLPAKLGLDGAMEAFEDLPQSAMHAELARRRVYLHPYRWTSLGLSLIEAMMIGMPVVALATTEAVEAVPPEAGVVSTKIPTLLRALDRFANEPELAAQAGKAARSAALARYNLDRFLADWDRLLTSIVAS